MVSNQTTRTLIPGVGTFDHPALSLDDEATGDDLGPQRLLGVLPGASTAIAGMTNDLYAEVRVGCFDGQRALATIGGIGIELSQRV